MILGQLSRHFFAVQNILEHKITRVENLDSQLVLKICKMTEGGPRVSVSRSPSALRFSNIVPGRSTISRQGRSTMTRSPGARNSIRGARDHSANSTNRASVQYHIYHDNKNIDYFANKRGIIRCQAWRLQVSYRKFRFEITDRSIPKT